MTPEQWSNAGMVEIAAEEFEAFLRQVAAGAVAPAKPRRKRAVEVGGPSEAEVARVTWEQRTRQMAIHHAQGVVCSTLAVLYGEAPLGHGVSDTTRDLAEGALQAALRKLREALDD